LRQQSLLGEFGRSALQTRDIGQILQRATALCAQGLETPLAKVLEYLPDDKRLLVRAGVGWAPGTIGQVSLGIDMESPAGYALQTGQMVISNHLQAETRFRTPKLLSDHGIKRAINVLIARGGETICRSASSRSIVPTLASSISPMRTSLPASQDCLASPSSGSVLTPT
jgi:GAF domain-containing protein